MTSSPGFVDVPVSGGRLRVARWGRGPSTVLGIHGITASSMSLAPIARHLGPGRALVAPDLRGRGGSAGLPGPFGMRAHAEDCASVLRHLDGDRPAVVVGESMGAFVAVVLAARHPGLVERLVLVDGGLPPAVPEDVDRGRVLETVLGPALARLRQTFASREAYFDFWRAHPALSHGWNHDVEAYLDYDLTPTDGGYRSKVSEEAVRADGSQNLTDLGEVIASLESVGCPIVLLRATRNLLDQLPPLLPDDVVAPWRAALPNLEDEVVEDTNHYTIMFGDRGARRIAARVNGVSRG